MSTPKSIGVTVGKGAEIVDGSLRMLRDQLLVRPLEWNASRVVHVVRHGRAVRGVVVAAGPGDYVKKYKPDPTDPRKRVMTRTNRFRAMTVKPGDTVELGGLNAFDGLGYNFVEVYVGGVRHLICQEQDVTLYGEAGDLSTQDEVTE